MQFIQNSIWLILNITRFCTDLPITEIAILSTLRKFEGCLEVEEWLKTGNKGHSSQAWLSLKLLPTFWVVLLIRDKAECYLIKVVTMRKLLISAAKMAQLWLSIVQHLSGDPHFLFHFCNLHVLENICTKFEKNLSDISTTPALP